MTDFSSTSPVIPHGDAETMPGQFALEHFHRHLHVPLCWAACFHMRF